MLFRSLEICFGVLRSIGEESSTSSVGMMLDVLELLKKSLLLPFMRIVLDIFGKNLLLHSLGILFDVFDPLGNFSICLIHWGNVLIIYV